MGMSSFILRLLAKSEFKKSLINQKDAIKHQKNIFSTILKDGSKSIFGKNFNIKKSLSYEKFKNHVPVGDYETLRPYILDISLGKTNILTRGRPMYFAITSGTTSGTKYIPLTIIL